MFKPQPISATEARKYFSQIINKVQFSSKSFVVKNYRRPAVRIVKEQYIAVLEEVIGKKTAAQIQQISGDDDLPEFAKVQEIKKIFQRRLSGSPPKTPPPKQVLERSSKHYRSNKQKPNPQHHEPQKGGRGGGEILLKGGRNYA